MRRFSKRRPRKRKSQSPKPKIPGPGRPVAGLAAHQSRQGPLRLYRAKEAVDIVHRVERQRLRIDDVGIIVHATPTNPVIELAANTNVLVVWRISLTSKCIASSRLWCWIPSRPIKVETACTGCHEP